jgi:gluconokinase
MMILLMGVSGVGKTAVGEQLARALGWQFLDADDFHPLQNVEKMRAGIALTDADRWPWLDLMNVRLLALQGQRASAVLACSALKQIYRERLAKGVQELRVVFLQGSFELIQQRLQARQHRYMPASLLASQFATLEPPADAITIDIDAAIDDIVARIRSALTHTIGDSSMETIEIKIDGMTCEGCVRSITNVLTRVPGVTSVQVSLAAGEAQVSFDGTKTNTTALRAAVDAAGYQAA